MQQTLGLITSTFALISSFLFTPQAFIKTTTNVLGDSDSTPSTTRSVGAETRVQKVRQMRGEFKEEVRTHREEKRAEFQSRKETFRNELQAIHDEKKQKIAETVCDRFETFNEKRTTHFTNVLTRLSQLLEKVENRKNKAAEHGIDTAVCDELIKTAHSALENAQTATTTQSGTSYTCTVTDEAHLGQTLGTTRQTMQADVKNVRDTIHQTKSSIMHAARCLKSTKGIDTVPQPTEAPIH